MTDLKTTISSLVTGVALLLKFFGGPIIPEFAINIIIALGVMAVGYFAKDGSKAQTVSAITEEHTALLNDAIARAKELAAIPEVAKVVPDSPEIPKTVTP
jgi:hypothetical protein